MPPRMKRAGGLTGLVDSDSEPDFDTLEARDVGSISKPVRSSIPGKKPRGRPPAANRVTKPPTKPTCRVIESKSPDAQPLTRRALADKNHTQLPARTHQAKTAIQDTDEKMADGSSRAKPGRGRPRASKDVKTEKAHIQPYAIDVPTPAAELDVDLHGIQNMTRIAVDVEMTDSGTDLDRPSPSGTDMRSKGLLPSHDTDGATIRRRLGELTNKYESLETRHRDLRDVGVKAAERNFERLKQQSEENALASKRLISQLKDELATQTVLATQAGALQQDLEQSESQAAELQEELKELRNTLSNARNEVKALSAKLAASRTAESHVKAPASAFKLGSASSRAAQSEVAHIAQVKEGLYRDLTDLIVYHVTPGEDEDVFDCVQTGRNGTLHFKLALENDDASESYENVQFTYRPQLDPNRDGDLMDVLPDYLVDEITFPRSHAPKFYTRVTKSLMERVD